MIEPCESVVFDMDGTLIDSSAVVPDAFRATLAEHGIILDRSEIVAKYSVGPPRNILSHFLGRPATNNDVDAYHDQLHSGANVVSMYKGIEAVLDALDGSVRLAVFTGASHRAAVILLGAVKILDRFEHVVGGDQVEHPKPHPAGLFQVFELLGVRANNAIYVGDDPLDMQAAQRAGCRPIAAGWGHRYIPQPNIHVAAAPGDVAEIAGVG